MLEGWRDTGRSEACALAACILAANLSAGLHALRLSRPAGGRAEVAWQDWGALQHLLLLCDPLKALMCGAQLLCLRIRTLSMARQGDGQMWSSAEHQALAVLSGWVICTAVRLVSWLVTCNTVVLSAADPEVPAVIPAGGVLTCRS